MGWTIFGILLGAGVLAVILWLRNRGSKVTWYEWLIGVIGVLLLVTATQHYIASMAEMYITAAWLGALIFGLSGIILLAVVWRLIARRQRAG